ncbi:MAG: hypothetical protein U0R65_02225 [Candidatus Nanopelagicales bacterium]
MSDLAMADPSSGLRYVTVAVTYGRTGSAALSPPSTPCRVSSSGENYEALRGLHRYAQSIAETADRHHAGRRTTPGTAARPGLVHGRGARRPARARRAHGLRPRRTRWLGFKEVRYTPGHFASYDDLLDYLLFLGKLLPGLVYVLNVREAGAAARSGWWPDDPPPSRRWRPRGGGSPTHM